MKDTKELTPEEWMMIGANRFQFCAWNFEMSEEPYRWMNLSGNEYREIFPRFIMEAEWTCSIHHIVAKWRAACGGRRPDEYFPRFYAELDGENRIAMLRWIMKNYTDEQKLSL